MESYYHSALTVDTSHAQKYFKDEDHSVLDDTILDHSGMDSGLELSPPMADSRRESFAMGPPLFSPKTEDWQSVDMQSLPSNNPFLDSHSTNPYLRLDQSQATYATHATTAWSMNGSSGSATPLQRFDSLPDFDSTASIFQRTAQGPTPFSNNGNMFASLASDNQSMPASPQKEWATHVQSANKKNSPTIRSHNELRRGDGIRKKNARFEIPAERNLSNIDHLIAQSNDDQEIKELKQQKRLLRNRQAA